MAHLGWAMDEACKECEKESPFSALIPLPLRTLKPLRGNLIDLARCRKTGLVIRSLDEG
jgi:hypothetical protein